MSRRNNMMCRLKPGSVGRRVLAPSADEPTTYCDVDHVSTPYVVVIVFHGSS